ncbi:MAG: SprT-like family-domain-containing protein [Monoraphidium minutum]|nr:MAG: SprT-like family-domain-containing protein [Monoraphidium minutum]
MDADELADLELLETEVDIHSLFQYYARLYFQDALGAASVEWSSKRMTLCGGTCEYKPAGGGVVIKLSEPLLKFRPVRDIKDVLLHEMIHAALFLDGRWRADGDHGPLFKGYAAAINASTVPDHQRPLGGYNITVFHTMHAEVDELRRHRWTCARCGAVVKRAMNRPPQPADCVTNRGRAGPGALCDDARCLHCTHVRTCGGELEKVRAVAPGQNPGRPSH